MNVTNTSVQLATWMNSLPIAKNYAGKLTQDLVKTGNTVGENEKKEGLPANNKMILYSGEVVDGDLEYNDQSILSIEIVPSSKREYTKEDALKYQYLQQFSFNINDVLAGKVENIKLPELNKPIPQEFIDEISRNGVTENSYDSSRTGFYLSGLDENNSSFTHSVEYLASGYAVGKQHIEDHYSGEEKAQLLKDLDTQYKTGVEIIARNASKEIGDFFEESGSNGEAKKVYDSVMKAYQDSVDQFSDYIKDNKNYAKLNQEDQWLRTDDSYMAGQLRKAIENDSTNLKEVNEGEYYSIDELDKAKSMITEIKSYDVITQSERYIGSNSSEEEIGFKLAELSLKGEIFNRFSGVSDSIKKAMTKSIEKFTSTLTDRLNEELKKNREKVAEPGKAADLVSKNVFTVYNRIMDLYKNTGDVTRALKEGAEFAKAQHMKNASDPQYSNLWRYGKEGSRYWNNFFENTMKYKSTNFVIMPNENGYMDKESGIDALTKSWNQFADSWTDDSSVKLNEGTFSAYA
jgi:hypothetical protein